MRYTLRPNTRSGRFGAAAGTVLGLAVALLAPGAPASAAPATTAPLIQFAPDWTTTVEGVITANGTVVVDYDPARLPTCRARYAGGDAWSINVEYRIDGGPLQRQPVTQLNSDRRQVKAPASLPVPAEARELELWFVSGDRTGCREYDSQYGANYRFPVAR
ncbi:DUF6209 family protein [Actinoplanes regularis]|uniref:DUF6209 family protein n=1 Tax=Actinoplanes regularis TaxID=52697 RepID=UPI0024A469C5|nr:DUF6209 family protein [Actinoplanes regularis]GLW33631.1 hypothetical protein Areg01_65690 [Actinoplanes regularis]